MVRCAVREGRLPAKKNAPNFSLNPVLTSALLSYFSHVGGLKNKLVKRKQLADIQSVCGENVNKVLSCTLKTGRIRESNRTGTLMNGS